MIECITFKGEKPGLKYLITGAIHGDEVCGPIAINKWIDEFKTGKRKLLKGELRFVPICNPKAYEQNIRFVEENLNRVIYKDKNPKSYERKLAQEVIKHLDWCDYHLDIHSYTADNTPFSICPENSNKKLINFIKSVTVDYIISNFEIISEKLASKHEQATDTYVINGGKISFTLECGQHKSETSPIVAYNAIEETLTYLNMIADETAEKEKTKPKIILAREVYFKKKEGTLTRNWKNLEPVKKGDILATYDDGETIMAPYDSCVFLCKDDTQIDQIWFHLGVFEN